MEKSPAITRWLVWVVLMGVYLTGRGYHSRDGDQAYRLPLLLHRQEATLYQADPFVRAFDSFNPHRGYLTLLDGTSRLIGLSASLFLLFAATFFGTASALDRLARAAWPSLAPGLGMLVVGLWLLTQAGNIGTNHLFEPMLLDRQIALTLGWNAIAITLMNPRIGTVLAPILLGMAALVHPSMGLQLALLLGASWWVWCLLPGRARIRPGQALAASGSLAIGLLPSVRMMAGQSQQLLAGLPPTEFRLLCLYVQSPQHMVPHLWRWSQWLAWLAFPALAILGGLASRREETDSSEPIRLRFQILLIMNLLGLAVAWLAVEPLGNLRLAVFQPFRMATVARGLCLFPIAVRVVMLWARGDTPARIRAGILASGLTGDLAMVVAAAIEISASLRDLRSRATGSLAGLTVLIGGVLYLFRHDTQSGYLPILAAIAGVIVVSVLMSRLDVRLTPCRLVRWGLVAWALPILALVVPFMPTGTRESMPELRRALTGWCRFTETPVDDIERLAVWCRWNTPIDASFVGPPGPKTFRLWSRRTVAFNRAASPYHATGLADWADRFRKHVGYEGSTIGFAQAYLANRQALEERYDHLTAEELADLARGQGASHVVARDAFRLDAGDSPLERLHAEGAFAVFRVCDR